MEGKREREGRESEKKRGAWESKRERESVSRERE